MRLVVVGASGYIGSRILATAPEASWGTGRSDSALVHYDLSIPDSFPWSHVVAGDTLVIAASVSSPDVCAREREKAWSINVEGTARLISKALKYGANVVFLSSDTVYGEQRAEVDESAAAVPFGDYAVMKHHVEKMFIGEHRFKSLRLSYVFSREDQFTKYLAKCAQTSRTAEVYHPFYRAIIHRDDVVEGILNLANRWKDFPQSILNFGGPELVARMDLAKALQEQALANLRFKRSANDSDFFLSRPRSINMLSPHLITILGRVPRRLGDAIDYEFRAK